MNMLKIVAVPMHKEGRKFVAVFAIITLLLALIWEPLFWIGAGLTVWCYYFFRDPERSVPQQDGLILSPADGVVSLISTLPAPPELGLGDELRVRVSVFMNVFNCHVNRAPFDGKVTKIVYHKGKFVNASLDKASEHNERNGLALETTNGASVGVVQIAGLVARRIVCFVQEGEQLRAGERFGLIRFGSRLDVYLPPEIQPLVSVGQTAVAGETILADLGHTGSAMTGRLI
ncbi:phosphatidylserine decarboxylase [Pseudohalocynthiibacter aestuariivivens]|jgi:phosphatidylserine decarboxylase|uniref:Phosphatidylserine decarboxylase proenzyme n=1 Tax=Pseudohalocynthiibacter aestuariivivens TaxID=1591409 RepID=A0ABV5JFU1_9RHOB|nr:MULTISPECIES: phosphatidylserine decarboxylase [Pseudohalocynthiibacter]MBS9716324.1 phosphatidylserine decarboxylase [Pseudohalocynthiibacter aestuariivivens]MCK0100868.1 phosphatidylserine decarboxylase [Pseudohalocynthiibacter sp. F2068]